MSKKAKQQAPTVPDVSAYLDLLGKQAKDRITGYTGTIITVAFDLFGCVQAIIRPPVDKEGKLGDGHFFDVNRLIVLGEDRAMPIPQWAAKPIDHDHGPAEKPTGRW